MMIVVKMMFLQELVLQAQQCCHSALRSCSFPCPAGDASGDRDTGAGKIFIDHRGMTQPCALGTKRSLHTPFLKGKNKSFPQLS